MIKRQPWPFKVATFRAFIAAAPTSGIAAVVNAICAGYGIPSTWEMMHLGAKMSLTGIYSRAAKRA